MRAAHYISIARTLDEPLLEAIGDLLWPTDDRLARTAAPRHFQEVAHRWIAADDSHYAVAHRLHPRHAIKFLVGERLVHALLREVEVQRLGQQRQPIHLAVQRVNQRHLVLGLGLRRRYNRIGNRIDRHQVRIASKLRHTLLEGSVTPLAFRQIRVADEYRFRPPLREPHAAIRRTRLDDHRMALRRTGHRECPPRRQEFAAVLHAMHLFGMREQAGLLVHNKRIILPGIPAAEHDFHEFVRTIVTQVVRKMDLAPHVLGFAIIDRGHHVPRCPAAQHVVHGLEPARHVERFVIRGGGGCTDTKPPCAKAHREQRCHRVHLHDTHAVCHHFRRIAAIDVRHCQPVVEEGELEFAVLEHLADLLVIGSRGEIRARVRMSPRACQRRAVLRLQETDEDHLAHDVAFQN